MRSSRFHTSLHRPRLIMGIEKGAFGALVLAASTLLVARAYWLMLALVPAYLLARWLSKKDDQFMEILARYLREEHVFDATTRPNDFRRRPKGFGAGLPR
jgi:type IV secretory pathway VirB3-like protein